MHSLKIRTPIEDAGPSVQVDPRDNLSTAISLPGHELPTAVYASVIGAFAWMLAVAWLVFSSPGGTNLDLGIVSVLALMFFAIPLAMHHTSLHSTRQSTTSLHQFLRTSFDSYTGAMPAAQAWIEVAIIPVGLALAATLIGIVYVAV
ncbi:MAG: hypothetical protein WC829_02515 [Hyphomicrobium sp.]|jgi:hypothetical protein